MAALGRRGVGGGCGVVVVEVEVVEGLEGARDDMGCE